MGKLIKFWFEEWHCNFTPNSYIWYTSKIPIQPNNYRSNFTTCLLYNTFVMPCVPWNIKSEISKPIKHCIANKIIKMSHILHIDKPEDCACAAEKSTLYNTFVMPCVPWNIKSEISGFSMRMPSGSNEPLVTVYLISCSKVSLEILERGEIKMILSSAKNVGFSSRRWLYRMSIFFIFWIIHVCFSEFHFLHRNRDRGGCNL